MKCLWTVVQVKEGNRIERTNHHSKTEKDEIFSGLIEKHYKSVYYFCYKKLNLNPSEAKDCTQEIFCTLYKKMDGLYDFDKIGPWLYRTANHHVKKILAKWSFENKKLIHFRFDGDVEDVAEYPSAFLSYEEDIDQLLESPLDVEECKKKVLAALSLEEMTLWYLFFIEKKCQKDISTILHISQAAVKSRVLRLKSKLNKQIEIIMSEREMNS